MPAAPAAEQTKKGHTDMATTRARQTARESAEQRRARYVKQLQQRNEVLEHNVELMKNELGRRDGELQRRRDAQQRSDGVAKELQQQLEQPVTVFRLVQYTGDREWVEQTIANSIHGMYNPGPGRYIIGTTVTEAPVLSTKQGRPIAWARRGREHDVPKADLNPGKYAGVGTPWKVSQEYDRSKLETYEIRSVEQPEKK